MAKVTGPLMSMTASGTVGNVITFATWKGTAYVRQRVIPTYTNTALQQKIRSLMTDASVAWKLGSTIGGTAIDAAYKLAYNNAVAGQGKSGFNLFMEDCVALNGGSTYDGSLELPTTPGDQTPA